MCSLQARFSLLDTSHRQASEKGCSTDEQNPASRILPATVPLERWSPRAANAVADAGTPRGGVVMSRMHRKAFLAASVVATALLLPSAQALAEGPQKTSYTWS